MAAGLITGAAGARAAARSILAEGRFHQPGVPNPLHGLLRSVGNVLESPVHAVEHAVRWLGARFPGGVPGVWAALAVIVVIVVVVLARSGARNRLASRAPAPTAADRSVELEAAAAAAERSGRFGEAVRLRFRAGLLALAERRLIPSGRTMPSREVSQALHSQLFDALAHRFDDKSCYSYYPLLYYNY